VELQLLELILVQGLECVVRRVLVLGFMVNQTLVMGLVGPAVLIMVANFHQLREMDQDLPLSKGLVLFQKVLVEHYTMRSEVAATTVPPSNASVDGSSGSLDLSLVA
jgi:hypothetical protein